ncbi:MAG: YeaH/YhbH family protein [Patescibacteria group bacterium]
MRDLIVDGRESPHGKNLGNRQRFIRRHRKDVKKSVDEAIRSRTLKEASDGKSISVPIGNTEEPTFHNDRKKGNRHFVLPGNKTYSSGDKIPIPDGEGGGGGRGKGASPDGEGEDDFKFVLTRDEFLSIFFQDLELPDLVKTSLSSVLLGAPRRAGTSRSGTPSNLDIARTMRMSIGRRIALHRPTDDEIFLLEEREHELASLEIILEEELVELATVRDLLDLLRRRQIVVPYIDPSIDPRYKRFELRPAPATRAVMFCLMDVSASMSEHLKDLSKRFFMLLHLFLTRHYQDVDVVFIRHTSTAKEVDEETFFRGTETGGTVISSALNETVRIIKERYNSSDWNIYIAQSTDGDNIPDDNEQCAQVMSEVLLPMVQYFAYLEVVEEQTSMISRQKTSLWTTYEQAVGNKKNFAMKVANMATQIYPVFRELFAKRAH